MGSNDFEKKMNDRRVYSTALMANYRVLKIMAHELNKGSKHAPPCFDTMNGFYDRIGIPRNTYDRILAKENMCKSAQGKMIAFENRLSTSQKYFTEPISYKENGTATPIYIINIRILAPDFSWDTYDKLKNDKPKKQKVLNAITGIVNGIYRYSPANEVDNTNADIAKLRNFLMNQTIEKNEIANDMESIGKSIEALEKKKKELSHFKDIDAIEKYYKCLEEHISLIKALKICRNRLG